MTEEKKKIECKWLLIDAHVKIEECIEYSWRFLLDLWVSNLFLILGENLLTKICFCLHVDETSW